MTKVKDVTIVEIIGGENDWVIYEIIDNSTPCTPLEAVKLYEEERLDKEDYENYKEPEEKTYNEDYSCTYSQMTEVRACKFPLTFITK